MICRPETCMGFVIICIVLEWAGRAESSTNLRNRLCGTRLTTALRKICKHRYRGRYPSPGGFYTQSPFSSQSYRRRPGIVDMCCHNQCSYSTLKSYCDDDEVTTTTTITPIDDNAQFPGVVIDGQLVPQKSLTSYRTHEENVMSEARDATTHTFPSFLHLMSHISDLVLAQRQGDIQQAAAGSSAKSQLLKPAEKRTQELFHAA